MTAYQLLLLVVLVLWPFGIGALLLFMNRLEDYVRRPDVETPQQAGVEPVAGKPPDREVRIVFGGQVVGEPSVDGNGAPAERVITGK